MKEKLILGKSPKTTTGGQHRVKRRGNCTAVVGGGEGVHLL
jgi:hypothetical protein